MSKIDFEAEGLLGDLEGAEREARLQLLNGLTADGVSLDELRKAAAEDRLVLLPVERVFDEPGARRYSTTEIAGLTGIDVEFLDRITLALGLSIPDPDQKALTEADLQAARRAAAFRDAGVSDEGILETARVIGMAMAQIAVANRDLIGRTMMRAGDSEQELGARWADAARALTPVMTDSLGFAYSLHLREAIRQGVVSRTQALQGSLPGSRPIAIGFADLVGFTKLGERLEVEAIGALTEKLSTLVSEVVRPPVRVVKMIGDAAMFASLEPEPVAEAALSLVEATEDAGIPSLRAGLALGEAIPQGGDWYGRPVNLAARITTFARPDSVLVDEAMQAAFAENGGFSFSFAGRHHFKGIRGEVAVHRMRRARPGEAESTTAEPDGTEPGGVKPVD